MESFDQGILLYVIIVTNLVMGFALMKTGQKTKKQKLTEQNTPINVVDIENFDDKGNNDNNNDNDNNNELKKDEQDENSEK